MCGISGYFCVEGMGGEARGPEALLRMNRAIAHRGPDDEGFVLIGGPGSGGEGPEAPGETGGLRGRGAPGAGIRAARDFRGEVEAPGAEPLERLREGLRHPHALGMGHRRFSILDPSPHGHQPMWSPGGEACLAFNGEIYNYRELRAGLEAAGRRFRGGGDTEVLLAAYLEWGPDCFSRFNGFWALALYDARRGGLLLSRDRIGKAPLYWMRRGGRLWWSSEIKGLLAGVETSALPVDGAAVRRFARHGRRDLADGTCYQDIRTFPRASWAWVEADGSFRPRAYWSLPAARRSPGMPPAAVQEAVEGFRDTLADAVRLRLRADVPLGLELSGGMDSSAVAALAAEAREGGAPLQAFTVSFPGRPEDETPFARAAAGAYAGRILWEPREYRPPDFFARAESYVAHMDEPFHSPAMLANQEIWRDMAARGIKVSLNGGGGDEVLAGYASEYFGPYLLSLLRGGGWGRFLREFARFSEHDRDRPALSWARELFHLLPPAWRARLKPPLPAPGDDPLVPGEDALPPGASGVEAALRDNMGDGKMNYWMRSGNLSCMQVPMEVRLPFLDHRVVEAAFSLPLDLLIRDGWLKWILREAMRGRLPEPVLWRRRKSGFPFPLRDWLVREAPRFRAFAGRLDCPFVDGRRLAARYPDLASAHPAYLWRLLSVGMWWRRCVEGRALGLEET